MGDENIREIKQERDGLCSGSEYESGSSSEDSEEDSESEYESEEEEEVFFGLKSPPEELSRKPPPSNPSNPQPYHEDNDFNVSEFGMCRLDSDPFPSILLDSSGRSACGNGDEMDNRKPPAKPDSEQADIDMSFLEVSEGDRACKEKFECPDGMSPEVFFQLPPEMQEEVINQKKSIANPRTDEIDPETLMSLPESIRQEVLDQAQQRQGPKSELNCADPPVPRPKPRPSLSKSTSEFLHECDIDAQEFENFPDDVKRDIMRQKARKSSKVASGRQRGEAVGQPISSYDPETLASLPDDVRAEVLNEERRERDRLERQNSGNRQGDEEMTSRPGAHCVRNVPAGYDPETFASLPADVREELMDDARRRVEGGRYSAGGHDDIVVPAQPINGVGRSTSCTYTGEYNIVGKRHGDGELLWANGDKYVGDFKNGYIDGRGTISFHDGTEYHGQWRSNKFHGEGTRRFKNGNIYNGNYANGKRQGQGKCYFANGDMYVGDWKNDTISGFGRYYYQNGHSFEGMFRDGKRNGRGKYQLTDGRVEVYRYFNDSRVGDGVRWSANRKKAWKMNDGKVTKRVSLDEAAAIAKRAGPLLEET
mmetsp:Transcript_29922/g.67539  ORF Transcript_29922/g.67539 Transcript_29922/m.67539 type:complete len:593 (-) Transcript_29922:41-1819(-)